MKPPVTAMLLAAGLGTRMLPLTADKPKTLLPLEGRPLIDHILDRLEESGVRRVVINTHWQAEQIEAHVARRGNGLEYIFRPETELLDTGGAVASALAAGALDDEPFFVVNSDVIWFNGPSPALDRLAEAHDPAQSDATLLFHRTYQVFTEVGRGDFALDEWGVPRLPGENQVVPYVFAGVQILSPAALAGRPPGAFSLYGVWTDLIPRNRIRAIVHDGIWFHMSRPADIEIAHEALAARLTGATT